MGLFKRKKHNVTPDGWKPPEWKVGISDLHSRTVTVTFGAQPQLTLTLERGKDQVSVKCMPQPTTYGGAQPNNPAYVPFEELKLAIQKLGGFHGWS